MPPFFDQAAALRSQVASNTYATASADTAVVVTLAGQPGKRHYVPLIVSGYDIDPPDGGRLTIAGLEGDDLTYPILRGGPCPFMTVPLVGEIGAAVTITLAAGGASCTGELNVVSALLPAVHEINGAPVR